MREQRSNSASLAPIVAEELEPRKFLSASLSQHVLTVMGTAKADTIIIGLSRSKANRLDVSINGKVSSFEATQLSSIEINGHAGNDNISFDELLEPVAIPSIIHGNGGADTIVGGSSRDQIFGDEGNDDLEGGGGRDTLSGGAGNDLLAGGGGNDILHGGAGNDQLIGGTGTDELFGEAGTDHFTESGVLGQSDQSGNESLTMSHKSGAVGGILPP